MQLIFLVMVIVVSSVTLFHYTCLISYNSIRLFKYQCSNILEVDVRNGSIFFLETSFRALYNGLLRISTRVACALESAALHHPNRSIYLLYVFPNVPEKEMDLDRTFFEPLLSTYPNVQIVYVTSFSYVKNTPVEGLYAKNIIDKSRFAINHHSDILRIVTLMRYGGIYMDSDVIVLKAFDDLDENFIALEIGGILSNAVIGFGKTKVGEEFLNNLLTDLNLNYNPKSWGGNGPILFTKWVQEMCNSTNLKEFSDGKCSFLRILSSSYFYPIYGTKWTKLFEEKYNEEVFKKAKNSYLIHFWNGLSSRTKLSSQSNASYLLLARKNCPKVYQNLEGIF